MLGTVDINVAVGVAAGGGCGDIRTTKYLFRLSRRTGRQFHYSPYTNVSITGGGGDGESYKFSPFTYVHELRNWTCPYLGRHDPDIPVRCSVRMQLDLVPWFARHL